MASPLDAETDPQAAGRFRRVLGQGLGWALLAVAVFFLWPVSLGGATALVIVSGQSMEPTYESGDLVISRKGEPQIGDVIIYAPEDLGGAQVVHRIIDRDPAGGWILQGDNNDFIDPFYPQGDEVRGIVQLHLPNAGVVTMWLLNPLLWLGVILVAMVLALWPASSHDDDEDDDADADAEASASDAEPAADEDGDADEDVDDDADRDLDDETVPASTTAGT